MTTIRELLNQQRLTLNDFNHYLKNINDIKQSIADPKKNSLHQSYASLLLTGPSGSGKSTLLDLVISKYPHEKLMISPTNYTNLAGLKIKVKHFMTYTSITSFFNPNPKIVVFEDADILLTLDKMVSGYLMDLVANKSDKLGFFVTIPICIVMNSFQDKKIVEFKEKCTKHTHLSKLNFKQCFQIVNRLLDKLSDTESMKYDAVDYEKLTKLIRNSQNDLRVVLNHLDEVFTESLTGCDTLKKTRFVDWNTNDVTKYILSNRLNTLDIYDVLSHESYVISCLVHENFPKILKPSNLSNVEQLRTMQRVNKSFIDADMMNRGAFEHNSSELWDLSNFYKVAATNYHLTEHKNEHTKIVNVDFSQLINKHSLALNFHKKLIRMELRLSSTRCDFFPCMLYYTYVLKHRCNKTNVNDYLDKNNADILARYLSDYDASLKFILSKLRKYLKDT